MRWLKIRKPKSVHGGGLSRAHSKVERPLDRKKWIHLVLKSERAKDNWSFLKHRNRIYVERILQAKARKFGVTIADFANVGNHLHLKVKVGSRAGFQNFLRAITTLIARGITGAKKGHKVGPFWQGTAFTRVMKSSLEVLRLKGYFQANRVEAARGKMAREFYLIQFNRWVQSLESG